MHCLVTGANGFVGRSLIPHLRTIGHITSVWPRTPIFDLANTAADTQWIEQLRGIDVVIHLAGIAHQIQNKPADENYFRINRDGTLALAAAAQRAGVKRFIFMSSAKVFGEGSTALYDESSIPAPQDAYAKSKWQAEQELLGRFAPTMEIVILRPPLVYGCDAKANFGNLIRLARLPIPLPFADIHNQRSLIGIDNLIDLMAHCLTSPAAPGKSWLCADNTLYSLADIVTAIRRAADKNPHLFRLPRPLMTGVQKLLGPAKSARLFGDFRMDCNYTYTQLHWIPPYSMENILRGDLQGTPA